MSKMKISNDEAVKWLCLFECIDHTAKFCENNNIDLEKTITRGLKPSHIKNYIGERFPNLCNEIESGKLVENGGFAYEFLYGGK